MSKNLAKVQDMLDGNYKNKIQVGVGDQEVEQTRKVGDKWTDSDGYEWEQKDGYQTKSGGGLVKRGMFNHQCKDCGKNCSPKMAKPWDRDVFKADGRCYHCQIEYEDNLKFDKPIRWFAYRRLKDLKNMDALEKDMIQWVDEITEERKQNPFDKTIANAMANGEIEMSIKNNTQ